MADGALRPKCPPGTPDALATIAIACFEPLPEHRPSFALISHHMRKARARAPRSCAAVLVVRGIQVEACLPNL